MSLLKVIVLEQGGTVTVLREPEVQVLVVKTLSPGPAFDALLERAEEAYQRLYGSARISVILSPKMVNELAELREKHGDTLTSELSAGIDAARSALFGKVSVMQQAASIARGETLSLIFEDETEPFYSDQIYDIEGTM